MVDVIDETGENLLSKHPSYWRGCLDSYTDEQGRTDGLWDRSTWQKLTT